jgi:hypothetical protein
MSSHRSVEKKKKKKKKHSETKRAKRANSEIAHLLPDRTRAQIAARHADHDLTSESRRPAQHSIDDRTATNEGNDEQSFLSLVNNFSGTMTITHKRSPEYTHLSPLHPITYGRRRHALVRLVATSCAQLPQHNAEAVPATTLVLFCDEQTT